jgi:type VI secretion system protein ImpM
VLGKHPSQGDFLSLGNRGHEFTSFDAFLTQGVEWAEARAGAEWGPAYAAGEVQAFVYRPTSGGRASALVGALGPSSDRAGRRFPLGVAMPLTAPPELLGSPEVLPLVLESCWQATSDFVLGAAAEPNASLGTRLASLVPPALELEEALVSYAEWTRSMPVEELWLLMFGEEQRVDPAAVLALVSAAARACGGVEPPKTTLALRLPLGAAGGAAVCFWLDWVRCITRWKTTVPTFFWSHDGRQGTMMLCLGMPPRCTLSELWLPTGGRDEICDIATAPWSLAVPDDEAAPFRGILAAAGRTIAGLLHAGYTLTR